MSEHWKQNNHEPSASEGNDVVALLKKIQQQLSFLERKVDMLVGGESSGRRPFSRPQRTFDRGRGESSGERKFEYRPKRSYGDSREGSSGPERSFPRRSEGPREGSREGFDRERKPFFHKRRGGGSR